MSVKFKLNFTISGEAVFALLSKLLPIEDLEVEELGPWPITGSKLLQKSATPLADREIAIHQLAHKPKPKPQRNKGPRLDKGINAIILAELSTGPKSITGMIPKVKAAGFSSNSVTSRMESLREFGVVERVGDGTWKRVDI